MNQFQHPDGERQHAFSLSPAEKAAGFAEVMKRLRGSSGQERALLRAQAEGAVLGHETYAWGLDNLRRGNHLAAQRWLRVAAEHGVPGAEAALEEIGARSAGGADALSDAEVMACMEPCPSGVVRPAGQDIDSWSALFQTWKDAGLAVDTAQKITAQARREADKLVATAQEDAEHLREEAERQREAARGEVAAAHQASAQLLQDIEQLQQDARILLRQAREMADAGGAWGAMGVFATAARHPGQAFRVDVSCRSGVPRDHQPSSSRPHVQSDTGSVSAGMEARTVHVLGLPVGAREACTQLRKFWVDSIVGGCARTEDDRPERPVGDARLPDGLPRLNSALDHAGVLSKSVLLRQEAPPDLVDIRSRAGNNLVFTHDTMRGYLTAQLLLRAVSVEVVPRSEGSDARWVFSEGEAARATAGSEMRLDRPHLQIWWLAEGSDSEQDGTYRSSVVMETEGASGSAPPAD
ncbi:DivIVA domain-containing protein [Streptomyces chartreusis]|uniref:DivIVA domain-containing protein n=1 Tax=Streptomyces chartreusis TaxID=1969 RepID=UPI0033E98086